MAEGGPRCWRGALLQRTNHDDDTQRLRRVGGRLLAKDEAVERLHDGGIAHRLTARLRQLGATNGALWVDPELEAGPVASRARPRVPAQGGLDVRLGAL